MFKQDQRVLHKFEFLESKLSRYKESSYNQLRPLIESPQKIFEDFESKTSCFLLYAHQKFDGELYILMSELLDHEDVDICSWFCVGFKKLQTNESVSPMFDYNAYCPFCDEVSKFNTDMPIELHDVYHCIKCRNFFEPTKMIFRFLGILLCLVFSLISLFLIFVGGLMLIDTILIGHFYSLFTLVAMVIILGGASTLFYSTKKIWLATKTPMLNQVSNFRTAFEDPEF